MCVCVCVCFLHGWLTVSPVRASSLDLSDTMISNLGAEALTNLTGLTRLDLSCTCLTDAGAAHLRLLPDLLDLRLESRHITDAALVHIQVSKGASRKSPIRPRGGPALHSVLQL